METGDLFAAKVLRDELADDPDARAKFIAEGRLLAGRDLPGIVRVHDVIDEPDKVVLIMDWVDGGDLRALIAAGPVPPARAASLAAAVADALATAQNAGMAHLDVKPEDILVTAEAHERTLLADRSPLGTPASRPTTARSVLFFMAGTVETRERELLTLSELDQRMPVHFPRVELLQRREGART